MKYIFILLIVCCSKKVFGQEDFLMLRKKGIVTQSYFVGSYLQCQLTNLQWVEGKIKKIVNDSLYVELMAVQQVANYWGLPTIDTLRYGLLKLSLKDIRALPNKERGIGIIKDGTLFTIGAGAYIGLNLANGLLLKGEEIGSQQNITNLSIAGCIFLFGKILHWSHPATLVLAKKYQLSTSTTINGK